jgi:hypothetical protein
MGTLFLDDTHATTTQNKIAKRNASAQHHKELSQRIMHTNCLRVMPQTPPCLLPFWLCFPVQHRAIRLFALKSEDFLIPVI